MSQTPSEPASPRTLARARARGDLPFASELPLALALLALVGLGAQPAAALAHALQGFAISAWSGELALADAWPALRGLMLSTFLLLCIPALAAFVGVLAQRAPTLRFFVAAGEAGSQQEQPGRPARGRIAHNLIAALKALVFAASLGVLLYDSVAGFIESYTRSSSQLLAITAHVLPALLLRAAWACLVIAALELGVQQLERMRRIPGADGWLLVSIQGRQAAATSSESGGVSRFGTSLPERRMGSAPSLTVTFGWRATAAMPARHSVKTCPRRPA